MRRALVAAGAALSLSLLPAAGLAQPRITAPVTDLADAVPADQEAQLTQKLTTFRQSSGVAVAVLVVPSTAPLTLEAYSMRVATAWREELLGATNAVVYVLAVGDRRHRLEVNDGARPRLPDARARELLDAARPNLRAADWGGAVRVVTDGVLTALAPAVVAVPTITEPSTEPAPGTAAPTMPVVQPTAPVAPARPPPSEGEKVCFALFCLAAVLLIVGLLVSLVVTAVYKAGRAITQSFSGGTTYGHSGASHDHGFDAHAHNASWFSSAGHDHGHDSSSASSFSSSDSSSFSSSDSSSSSGGGFSGGGASSDW